MLCIICLTPLASGHWQRAMDPWKIDIKVLNNAEHNCLLRERALDEFRKTIQLTILKAIDYLSSTAQPTTATIFNVTPAVPVETTVTCNGTPGWKRIAFFNMTNTSYNCPSGLTLTSNIKRTCGRSLSMTGGCTSTVFTVNGIQYHQVCGRIRGYQYGATAAFSAYRYNRNIDEQYLDGISLTHGRAGMRQHIWTFAAGINELPGDFPLATCPCVTQDYSLVPPFVGNDYFCESAVNSPWTYQFVFFPNDVLWDGQECSQSSTCCQLNNPPWFTKILPNSTTNDIELRICSDNGRNIDDIPIELIELYIK